MTSSSVHRATTIVSHALVCGGVAFLAFRLFRSWPREWHAGVLGASAALVTILSAVSMQVFGKYDRLLQDAEGYDVLRMRQIYRFLSASRRRLVWLLFVVAGAGIYNAGAAILLPKTDAVSDSAARILASAGYAGITLVLLYAYRIVDVYLAFDGFRREVVEVIMQEKARIERLLEMRPSVLRQFEDRSVDESLIKSG